MLMKLIIFVTYDCKIRPTNIENDIKDKIY